MPPPPTGLTPPARRARQDVRVRIGVPSETAPGERRVALVPEVAGRLAGRGLDVVVEPGAGAGARLPDAAYVAAGATLGDPYAAELLTTVAPPSAQEIARLAPGTVVVGFLQPLTNPAGIRALADARTTAFALEAVPRISRAQSMDALSSQSNVAGYKAVLVAAAELGRFFPMLMTAAGTVPPARVLVLGAGVAGLQAIATARRLGAVVTGYDVRAAVQEQVESLGASFLTLTAGAGAEGAGGYARELTEDERAAQQEELADAIAGFDVVITTALVPGRAAPLLVTEGALEAMRPGSVVVDLAGEAGGNCALSEPGATVVRHDVTIAAPLNLPATVPEHASALYARNVQAFVELVTQDGALQLDFDDEVVAGACVVREGAVVHPGAQRAVEAAA